VPLSRYLTQFARRRDTLGAGCLDQVVDVFPADARTGPIDNDNARRHFPIAWEKSVFSLLLWISGTSANTKSD
jgi:hypothetical protein